MKTRLTKILSTMGSLLLLSSFADAALIGDFTVTNRATNQPIRRADFEGKILFLDFFAYWCGPCQASSPVVETEIAEYYKTRGGNPNGIEVVVIGVNIESNNPAATDQFIASAGLENVANDYGDALGLWAKLGGGGIPHFAIINGVSGGPIAQWEILHSQAGFYGADYYKRIIDGITAPPPPPPTAPEIAVESPVGTVMVDGISKKKFGKVQIGRSVTKSFTIKNTGTAALTGVSMNKYGTHQSEFTLIQPWIFTINPGQSITFKAIFRPRAVGYRKALLRIYSNDATENPFDIMLRGEGIAATN